MHSTLSQLSNATIPPSSGLKRQEFLAPFPSYGTVLEDRSAFHAGPPASPRVVLLWRRIRGVLEQQEHLGVVGLRPSPPGAAALHLPVARRRWRRQRRLGALGVRPRGGDDGRAAAALLHLVDGGGSGGGSRGGARPAAVCGAGPTYPPGAGAGPP
ncbi:hypothetical protein THAOC_06364 [Thalassiosira oceanica]|uniref:Uncharacterized protein n=1 Tax=Thalassiosira oceanica TaxID=159749 RepID=K0T358_THAOC|nr:hypothetical protein THAOC_06364 [Thalassiosira oceanica]|eukprot:EJK72135.1 hypothetical protein THAOC_06364 [Thalassiosira oceanica]